MTRILTILPKGEGFSPEKFGAIALCVRDFTYASRYRKETTVLGGASPTGFEGLEYHYIPAAPWYQNRSRAYIKACAKHVNNEKADLAEIHNRPLLVHLLRKQVSCKLALHFHNDPQEMDKARTPKERMLLLALCEGVYCVSHFIRKRFIEGLPEAAHKKVYVVYNGIEIPDTVPAKEKRIVFAGRMTHGKGALLLAQALQIALPHLPDWSAIFIGSQRHEVGTSLSAHEREIERIMLPLAAQAELMGFLSHPETLAQFARADIAVVPSVWEEPFGRTALEAMAYSCALISSGRGGLAEITQEAALTLSVMTPQVLAEAILKLATNLDLRTALQKQAKLRAAHFAIADCTRSLDDARAIILQ